MDPYSSSSGDVFDSQGFNEFMGAGSSSEDAMLEQQIQRPEWMQQYEYNESYEDSSDAGDEYDFRMDFSKVQAPPKTAPPQPERKSSLKDSARGENIKKGVSFGEEKKVPEVSISSKWEDLQKQFMNAMQVSDTETSEITDSVRDSISGSGDLGIISKVAGMHWSNARDDILESQDLKDSTSMEISAQFQTEPFRMGQNAPISLTKKLGGQDVQDSMDQSEISQSLQAPQQSAKQGIRSPVSEQSESLEKSDKSRSNSQQAYTQIEQQRYDTSIQEDLQSKSRESLQSIEQSISYSESNSRSSPNIKDNYEISSSIQQSQQSISHSNTNSQQVKATPIVTNAATFQQLAWNQQQTAKLPNTQKFEKPSVLPVYPPQQKWEAKKQIKDIQQEKVPQQIDAAAKYELSYLQQRVQELEETLTNKNIEIAEYKKSEVLASFSRIEQDALEKAKNRLREANHIIELDKIEMEELTKQIDYANSRIRDLESENYQLQLENQRKFKITEEKLRLSESKTEERFKREVETAFQLEKEELLSKIKLLQDDVTFYKPQYEIIQNENKDLRLKLLQKHDENQLVKNLQSRIFELEAELHQLPPKQQLPPDAPRDLVKEIQSQEALITGFQRENERLTMELKQAQQLAKSEKTRYMDEVKRLEHLKASLLDEHGGILIKENVSDLPALHDLVGGMVVNKQEYQALRERAVKLQQQLSADKQFFQEREKEYAAEIQRLRNLKFNLEDRMEHSRETELEAEINRLNEKLQFYEQNWSQISEKDKVITSLQEQLQQKSTSAVFLQAEQPVYSFSQSEQPNQSTEKLQNEASYSNEAVMALQSQIQTLKAQLQAKDIDFEERLQNLRQEHETLQSKYNRRIANTIQGKRPQKPTDSISDLRIKELEKQLSDTKSYYINRLKSAEEGTNFEAQLNQLRQMLNVKDTIIKKLRAQEVQDDSYVELLYNLLSSQAGSLWSRVYVQLDRLNQAIQVQDKLMVQECLEKCLEVFQSEGFRRVKGLDQLYSLLGSSQDLIIQSNWDSLEENFKDLVKYSAETLKQTLNENVYFKVQDTTQQSQISSSSNQAPQVKQAWAQDSEEVINLRNRVSQLEQQLKQKQLQNVDTDISSQIGFFQEELKKAKIEKLRLENYIENMPKQPPGVSELIAIQRRIEIMEDNHYRREQELKNNIQQLYNRNSHEITLLKDKHEKEKESLYRVISVKNTEISHFRQELDILLQEMDKLRVKKVK